ncbi:hypothetical protein [Sphingopyxis sp.]|uniref:hypothetical protein n=1 Tax=Sphingopyxis sp. TaxID=1908224 RepID=UPI001D34F890|nr:hypothetical protein [Sphingopyxis sp.]MBW8297699.1 hypothetical protein [Sphingopyxis sp.]
MKSQDILVLLKWVSLESQELGALDRGRQGVAVSFDPFSVRELGLALYISKTEISESLHRSVDAGLAIRSHGRIKPNRRNMLEFIIHGLKYAFPAKKGAPERGVATAFAAPMLQGDLISAGSEIFVWPYAEGKARGASVAPLFKSVPQAALQDALLYEYLALIDAVRLGNQRESKLAGQKLEQRLLQR